MSAEVLPAVPLTPEERRDLVIWAAGFLDGEGCFSIYDHSGPTGGRNMRVVVFQVDVTPLWRLASLWGGSIGQERPRSGRAPCHHWLASGSRARRVCAETVPFLVNKKAVALLCLEFGMLLLSRRDAAAIPRHGGTIPAWNRKRREELYVAIRALNQRGVPRGPEVVVELPDATPDPQLNLFTGEGGERCLKPWSRSND